MKKFISAVLFLTAMLIFLLTSCHGDLKIEDIKINTGLKTEYTIGEAPDFSEVFATVYYNDGTAKSVGSDELCFSGLDTSTVGTKQLTVSYGGFVINVTIEVVGKNLDVSTPDKIITAVSLPEHLSFWQSNKQDFINQSYAYAVGDDNPFLFTLKLSVYSSDGEKLNITSYRSCSYVHLAGEDTPLTDDELDLYVTIDEEKNSFDFTEEAIGKNFTIYSRPADVPVDTEAEMTKSVTVTIVDGYNIYKAFELNYITNKENGFDFSDVDPEETRLQREIVDDFLLNEKGVTRPVDIAGIVLHNNLTIETTDIPKEYFYNKDRNSYLYDFLSVFDNMTTEDNPSITIHGNYFAIFSYNLPSVVPEGVGNQNNMFTDGSLFRFACDVPKDKYFDHTLYSANIKNLMLVDNNPQSNNESATAHAMLGVIAMKTAAQVINVDNSKFQSFGLSIIAENDYQTINANESIFANAWQNHIHLKSQNTIQGENEEPLPKDIYPRITLNITKTTMTESGGPAIITQVTAPMLTCNKNSGAVINISEDSTVESWLSGEEAWFKAWQITFIAPIIRGFDKSLQSVDSSFITEDVRMVDGKPTTLKLMNIIAVNLMIPNSGNDIMDIYGQITGSADIDGKILIGNNAVLDMDDCTADGQTLNFGNPTIGAIKNQNSANHVFATSEGIGYTTPGGKLTVAEGDLSSKGPDDYLTLYFYTIGLLIGNYHPI